MGMATDTAFMREKMPNGVILAFKIGGKATLPPHQPIPLDRPQPSNERFTPAQVATGARALTAPTARSATAGRSIPT